MKLIEATAPYVILMPILSAVGEDQREYSYYEASLIPILMEKDKNK